MLSRLEAPQSEALQRVAARGRLGVRLAHGRSRVATLGQEGAANIRMPKTVSGPLEAVLINTAGGLTGGDRLAWEIDVGEAAAATVTTQASEKVYRASSGVAEVECRLTVGSAARLAWLPQETIVFDRSAFSRRLEVNLAKDAEALIVEATVFGRLSMGERTKTALFRDRWRIRQSGKLIHAENFAIGPNVGATLARSAGMGGCHAMATVLLVCRDAGDRLGEVRVILGDAGAASAWTVGGSGKLLARLVAEDSYSLRRTLVPLIELLNGRAGLPKVWSL
ncbi:MAG TPA: urease accessory protein UreD [Rhizobiaceae bacterium]|nr:urease accessory protein UreD [Rhizobiaceae bacterium]